VSKRVEIAFDFSWQDVRRVEDMRWRGCKGAQLLPQDFPDDARLVRWQERPERRGYSLVYEVPRDYAERLGLKVEPCRACPTCATADAMTPRHDASPSCESGGRDHCTCDRCY
jgi:hypothetical protein